MNAIDQTADPREIAYYRALATTWWDRQGPFWPLHRLNAFRVEYLKRQLSAHFGRNAATATPFEGLHVLDVGCGGGILSESMAELGAKVVAIDVVDRNILIAAEHARQSGVNVDYRLTSAAELADTGERFDVVLNMEVVEHVADLPAFMASCNRLVRPGGQMVVSTINRTWRSYLFAIIGAEYILRWLPRGTHRWSEFRKPDELRALLAEGRLVTETATGVRVNPLTRSFSLTSNLAVNYMMVAQKLPSIAG